DRNRCLDRRLRVVEGGEEAVAGALDDLAALVDDPLAQDLVVAREQSLPLLVAERLEQLGRVHDVGEDERPSCLETPEALLHALFVELRTEALERRERR